MLKLIAIITMIIAIPVPKIVLNAVEFPTVATTIGCPLFFHYWGGVSGHYGCCKDWSDGSSKIPQHSIHS